MKSTTLSNTLVLIGTLTAISDSLKCYDSWSGYGNLVQVNCENEDTYGYGGPYKCVKVTYSYASGSETIKQRCESAYCSYCANEYRNDGCSTSETCNPNGCSSVEICYCSTDLCNYNTTTMLLTTHTTTNTTPATTKVTTSTPTTTTTNNSENSDNSSAFHGVTLDLFCILIIIYHLK